MAKSKRKSGKKSGNKKNTATRVAGKAATRDSFSFKSLTRRSVTKYLIGAAVLVFGITSLYAYDKKEQTLRDLSVIGEGKPVVVQIYDPSCATCKRLKNTASMAVKDNPDVDFRIADITTSEGKAVQNKYRVPHITLLYLDARGKHLHTTSGFMTANEIEDTIEHLEF